MNEEVLAILLVSPKVQRKSEGFPQIIGISGLLIRMTEIEER